MKNRPYSEDQDVFIRLEYTYIDRESDEYKSWRPELSEAEKTKELPFIEGQGKWFRSTPTRIARLEKIISKHSHELGQDWAHINYLKSY